jgi:hypothetical protein
LLNNGMDEKSKTAEPVKPKRRWFQFRLCTLGCSGLRGPSENHGASLGRHRFNVSLLIICGGCGLIWLVLALMLNIFVGFLNAADIAPLALAGMLCAEALQVGLSLRRRKGH